MERLELKRNQPKRNHQNPHGFVLHVLLKLPSKLIGADAPPVDGSVGSAELGRQP